MTPTSFIDEMAETYLNGLTLFSWVTHTTEHTVLSLALHKSSYTSLQLKRPGWICGLSSHNLWIDLRGASSDNKSERHEGHRGFRCVRLGFSVDSARGGWSGPACHSQRPQLAPAETSTPCEWVSESSGLIGIWSDPLTEEPWNKQGYTSRTVAWCSAGLHQACAFRLLA